MKRRDFLAAGLNMTGESRLEVLGAPIQETRFPNA